MADSYSRPPGKILLGGTAKRPEDVIALQKLGLRFAEITIENPADFRLLINDYQSLSKGTGFFYLCHGPREGDPNDVHSLETVYLPKVLQVIEIMTELEMRLLTLHLWMDPRFVSGKALACKIGFLERVIEKAAGRGIPVCLENLSENHVHLAEVLAALPELDLTLDLGHAELLTEVNTSFGFFDNYPDRIRHIHLHDNRGGNTPEDDLHLPPGEGGIDLWKIFERLHAISYRKTITLELRPDQIASCLEFVGSLAYPA